MLLRQVRDTRADAEAVRAVAAAGGGAAEGGPAGGEGEWAGPRGILFQRTTRHLAATDPGGCWLAEDAAGRPVGAALAARREGLWGLALLAVVPQARGKGVGTTLLRRAMAYARGTLRGMVCAPPDPMAARVLRAAGFTLHPLMRMHGTVDASRLATPDGPAIEGGRAHRDLMDSVDRRLRGGAHGRDHEELLRHCRVVVADDLAGSGYCYLDESGGVELLAATSRRIAARLLTSALLSLPPGAAAAIPRLTAEQEWAVDVGLAAGLRLAPGGYLCLRGMRPPAPYLPSAAFL
ncbi:GNAT family N-acetyltransferase [Streptomyces hoynatensis]|uniref:GNAT family N-acetyltransferase n=1 Tax=Streptomyces hoynatensis TaxID=1141874 RepID=A0A3A9Z2I5_9ACTN|nr:GNAT family N-acetyltransferase [Streptomyces hoynatensis]RKN42249.1 GNAT family N-acetyltransferase [Streptomyces hoynatensis]